MDITTWVEAIEAFNDWLDECVEDYKVGNMAYRASHVLENVDPIAYRCLFFEWADNDDLNTDELEGVCELP